MEELDYDNVTDEYKWYAEAVGKGVRAMSLGTIGAIWAVMSADGVILEETGLLGFSTSGLVKSVFIFASAALLFDLMQSIAAFWMYHVGLEKWEQRKKKNQTFSFKYDTNHLGKFGVFLYWSNTAFFPIKLVLASLAGGSFVCFAFAISISHV